MRPPLPIVKTYRLFQIKVGRRCWSRAPTWDWVSPSRLLLSYRWGLGRLKNVEEVEGWGSFERIVRIQMKIYVSPTFDESPGPSEVFFTNMRSMSMLLVSWSSCVDSCELIEAFISYDETAADNGHSQCWSWHRDIEDYINKTKVEKVIMACRSKEKCENAMQKLGFLDGWSAESWQKLTELAASSMLGMTHVLSIFIQLDIISELVWCFSGPLAKH